MVYRKATTPPVPPIAKQIAGKILIALAIVAVIEHIIGHGAIKESASTHHSQCAIAN
jgi:hypothetical protein